MQIDLNDKNKKGFFLVIDFQELEYCVVKQGGKRPDVGGDGHK